MRKKSEKRLRQEALAQHLQCDWQSLKQIYGDYTFEFGNQEYMVLYEDEAEDIVGDKIRESLWAFKLDFLMGHLNISDTTKVRRALQRMQKDLCEESNDIFHALIINMDDFVKEAIASDGRGQFLSGYDGEEHQVGEFFIYRLN